MTGGPIGKKFTHHNFHVLRYDANINSIILKNCTKPKIKKSSERVRGKRSFGWRVLYQVQRAAEAWPGPAGLGQIIKEMGSINLPFSVKFLWLEVERFLLAANYQIFSLCAFM